MFKLFFLIALILYTNLAQAARCLTVDEVSPGFFIHYGKPGTIFQDGDIANTGFIIGQRAVAVIDTGDSPSAGAALFCAIRQYTDLPISHVINTHVHPDHVLGNSAFKASATQFVGHHHLPRAIALLGATYLERFNASAQVKSGAISAINKTALMSPDRQVEIDHLLEIDLGGRQLQVMAMPQAHTDNDLIVFDPSSQTLWLGDLLFVEHIPVLGGSGSVNGWLDVLDDITQRNDVKRWIPGHGTAVSVDSDALQQQYHYLEETRAAVRHWLAEDKPLRGALETIGQETAYDWPMAETYHPRNISYMYSELEWE